MIRRMQLLLVLFLVSAQAFSQPPQHVKVIVGPDRADWTYKTNDKAKFSVTVLQDGVPMKNVKLRYEYGPEKMTPTKKDSAVLSSGTTTIDAGTLKTPGFLRCIATVKVDGKEYRGLATAGFDPSQIKPTIESPSDFTSFWEQAKAELAKIPVDARMTLLPERSTEKVNVYHVSLQNFRPGARLYGILCVPKAEGKYPALLQVPGAGVRPYQGQVAMAERGLITFEIGIHGIPVNMEPSVYAELSAGILNGYSNYNMDNRDRYFYKRVYLGCLRANDFLTSLPQYDGTNLAVCGGSQGGALSVVTAALDSRVKYLAAYHPALSDVTGYLHGRAGGWPHMFDKNNLPYNDLKEKKETMKYYDVVNFARLLKVPCYFSWGFNDETCPPTSMYATYNVITSPKELYLALDTGHWMYPEQREKFNNWLVAMLKKGIY